MSIGEKNSLQNSSILPEKRGQSLLGQGSMLTILRQECMNVLPVDSRFFRLRLNFIQIADGQVLIDQLKEMLNFMKIRVMEW